MTMRAVAGVLAVAALAGEAHLPAGQRHAVDRAHLHVLAQAIGDDRARHHRPGGGLLRHCQRAGVEFVGDAVELAQEVDRRKERREIEVAPLAFMRGRTLNNAFVVIDEAHHASSPSYRVVIDQVLAKNPNAAICGLTATPNR